LHRGKDEYNIRLTYSNNVIMGTENLAVVGKYTLGDFLLL